MKIVMVTPAAVQETCVTGRCDDKLDCSVLVTYVHDVIGLCGHCMESIQSIPFEVLLPNILLTEIVETLPKIEMVTELLVTQSFLCDHFFWISINYCDLLFGVTL